MMQIKEEKAIILDYLPNGYPLGGRRMPIAQAMGTEHFTLLELVPRKGVSLELKEEVYIGEGKRDKIYFIAGKLPKDKLTETAKLQLQEFVEKAIDSQEKKFVDFFNNASAINARVHQFELLPGFGKKYTRAIIDEREKSSFLSFEDIKQRLKNLPDPKKIIIKRIIEELIEEQRYKLFTN